MGRPLDFQPATDLTHREGFKFTVERVTPDPNDKDNAALATPVGLPEEVVTGTDGTATLTNLQAGVYRVTETEVPAGSDYVAGGPFLVSVPCVTENGEPINNVHVYPKNTKVTVEKEVADAGVHGGGEYIYTITSGTRVPPRVSLCKTTKL